MGVGVGGVSVRIKDEGSVGQDLHALRHKASADFHKDSHDFMKHCGRIGGTWGYFGVTLGLL